ncbi:MAG: radical SAM protein [Nitrospinaceae bacterium]
MFRPDTIYIEESTDGYPLVREVLKRFPDTPVCRSADEAAVVEEIKRTSADPFGTGKRRLYLSQFKGSFLKKCPGISPGMVCCNYLVVNLLKNCVYDCSYCFLQDFLGNNPLLTAYVNVEDLLQELDRIFTAQPEREFRVGTGELTDSLALDEIIPFSEFLIPFFNKKKNAVLELKTKSDEIGNLLKQDDPGNVIVSWSVNPQSVIDLEEKGTPNLKRRLEAARRCQEKGYRIGIHLDPIILFPGWEQAYEGLVRDLFRALSPSAIAWVSLGSFRFRPNLKKIIKERHADTRLFTGEHAASKDGKYRYLRPLRNLAYQTIQGFLKRHSEEMKIYMCMETKEVWQGVTGKLPRADEKLEPFFTL